MADSPPSCPILIKIRSEIPNSHPQTKIQQKWYKYMMQPNHDQWPHNYFFASHLLWTASQNTHSTKTTTRAFGPSNQQCALARRCRFGRAVKPATRLKIRKAHLAKNAYRGQHELWDYETYLASAETPRRQSPARNHHLNVAWAMPRLWKEIQNYKITHMFQTFANHFGEKNEPAKKMVPHGQSNRKLVTALANLNCNLDNWHVFSRGVAGAWCSRN